MNAETVTMVREWLDRHRGDREATARYMSSTLRIGGIKACRLLLQQAIPEPSATEAWVAKFEARCAAGEFADQAPAPAAARCVIRLDTCRPVGGVK